MTLQEDFKAAVVAAFAAGLTEAEVSHRLGVSRPTVHRWLSGENAPHPLTMPWIKTELAAAMAEKAQKAGKTW